jgi:hypothetical protein
VGDHSLKLKQGKKKNDQSNTFVPVSDAMLMARSSMLGDNNSASAVDPSEKGAASVGGGTSSVFGGGGLAAARGDALSGKV